MARLARAWKETVAFVPTMGALHDGHVSLLQRARKLAGKRGTVVASIFVNPLQFGPREDFSRYPRPLAADLAKCAAAGVDHVFLPRAVDMYAPDRSTFVDEESVSLGLCGASRPGHFRGVCTVVTKLFNLVRPDIAIFGRKDWQQVAVIRRMVRDLNQPVRIVAAPTHREPDGLAMSSRNVNLTAAERVEAPALRRALRAGAACVRAGETDPAVVIALVRHTFERSAPLAQIDYVEVLAADSLDPINPLRGTILLAAAAFFSRARVIDNLTVRPTLLK